MKVAIRYYTRTGNTKKLAEAVAEALGQQALPVTEPLEEDLDCLFLASSVYAAGVANEVKDFIRAIDVKVGQVVNLSTAALIESTYGQVSGLLEEKGLEMAQEEFHCRGQFTLLHRGRPNDKDLKKAVLFAKEYVSKQ